MNQQARGMENHLINAELQQQLREEYETKNYAVINASREEGKPDSLEYSFNLNILEEYLHYVRNHANEQGINNVTVKICMAQYPESHPDSRMNQNYRGYQTIFLKAVNSESDADIDNTEGLNFTGIRPPY